jgi:hypothetical protein
VHTPAPPTEYFPAEQIAAVALVDPTKQKYPAAQDPLQLDTAIAAVDPYRPAAQSTHTLAPLSEYLPAGHAKAVAFVDPAAQMYPALQLPVHPGNDRPDVDPYNPAAHGAVHDAAPILAVAPYSPAAQFVHTPAPAREYLPAGQLTAVARTDAAGHAYPAMQGPLHTALDIPLTSPYLPGAHGVHADAPPVLYCPAAHGPLQLLDTSPREEPNVPAGHAMQLPEPSEEYCPGEQAAGLVDPCGQWDPAGQGPVHSGDVKFSEEPYLPAKHRPEQVEVFSPAAAPYVPARHGEQTEESLPAS